MSTRVNPEALREITGPSGGYTEVVRSAADLGPATQRIAEELNKQYTLGYADDAPPGWKLAHDARPGQEPRIHCAFAPRLLRPPPEPRI